MDLEEKYKKETGKDTLKLYKSKEIGFSIGYVEWLEKQILTKKKYKNEDNF